MLCQLVKVTSPTRLCPSLTRLKSTHLHFDLKGDMGQTRINCPHVLSSFRYRVQTKPVIKQNKLALDIFQSTLCPSHGIHITESTQFQKLYEYNIQILIWLAHLRLLNSFCSSVFVNTTLDFVASFSHYK